LYQLNKVDFHIKQQGILSVQALKGGGTVYNVGSQGGKGLPGHFKVFMDPQSLAQAVPDKGFYIFY
jgi:hypothetical protein